MTETEHGSSTPLLNKINSPEDLKNFSAGELPEVCRELRQFIIENCSQNPGHFASSMGAVEIAVALHYVFNTPNDRIVWDVGHQAYAHKILTGRKDQFSTLRKYKGLSGFPNPDESPYDTFIAGHASNSISAALGMAMADSITPGSESRKTVAVIGDASISGGLAFEGLNNAANNRNNLLIILNDNDMSIDDNVGALHRYLTELNTSAGYNRWRNNLYQFFKRHGMVDDNRKGRLLRFNNSLKALISDTQNIFEGLNIRYFGPFDGNDIEKLVKVLNDIKDMEGPRLLHLRTIKGKGFASAEKNPSEWHAPGKFDPATGERIKITSAGEPLLWQQVFGNTLVELADTDHRVVGITAAMSSGTSMNMMFEKHPDRTFDVGISEGHAVTFAGGLASAGKRPFVAIYSAFLQRAYDNIIHDVSIAGLPVTFCIDRAGIVGEDGVTHHGTLDLCYLKCIPGMKVASPMDEETLRNLMFTSLTLNGPMAIRYPRGKGSTGEWKSRMHEIPVGKSRVMAEVPEGGIAILSIGPVGSEVTRALEMINARGIIAGHIDMIWLKPLDTDILDELSERAAGIITVEDGTLAGGLGASVASYLKETGSSLPLKTLGIPDKWVAHGTVAELRAECGFDAAGICEAAESLRLKIESQQ